MQTVEAEGSTIDEAIARALEALGADRDKVEIEIMSTATRGFLGIGGHKARVRATVRRALSSAMTELADRDSQDAAVPARRGERDSVPPAPERVQEIVREMLRLMGVHAEVAVAVDAGDEARELKVTISGDGGGLLIGRGGRTLDAIEYLVSRMVGRDGVEGRVAVDAEGYRERRRAVLSDMAVRLAEKVKRRRKPVATAELSPRDRRTVHMALRADPLVATRSLGRGYYRKVVIAPGGDAGR